MVKNKGRGLLVTQVKNQSNITSRLKPTT